MTVGNKNLGALGQPISRFVTVRGWGSQARAAREALAVISRVHGAAHLTPITVAFDATIPGDARFIVGADNQPACILLKTTAPDTAMALAHEVGHFLDFAAFHRGVGYASESPADTPIKQGIQNVLNAAAASQTFHALHTLASRSTITCAGAEGIGYNLPVNTAYVRYNLRVREVFARAYAQYITTRSGIPLLLGQLEEMRRVPLYAVFYPVQWPDADFEGIAAALDDLFVFLEWRAR